MLVVDFLPNIYCSPFLFSVLLNPEPRSIATRYTSSCRGLSPDYIGAVKRWGNGGVGLHLTHQIYPQLNLDQAMTDLTNYITDDDALGWLAHCGLFI